MRVVTAVCLLLMVAFAAVHADVTTTVAPTATATSVPPSPSRWPVAVLKLKTYGDIIMQLRPDAAPKTVENFVALAKSGFYTTGCTLYRNSPNFVIQGGNLNNASNSTVPLEYKLPNTKYSVGLARAAAPDTGSSEFFINVANNTIPLEPNANSLGYAVFAIVIKGFEIIEQLQKLPTNTSNPYGMHLFDHQPVIENIEIR